MFDIDPGIIHWASAGAGAGASFYAFKFLLEWLAGRMDKRAFAIDAGTAKLIENLERRLEVVTARLDRVEEELLECKKMHAESEAEVFRLKALMQGYGDARQISALIAAKEITEVKKFDGPDRGDE